MERKRDIMDENILLKAKRFSLHFLSTFISIQYKSELKLPPASVLAEIFIFTIISTYFHEHHTNFLGPNTDHWFSANLSVIFTSTAFSELTRL